MLSKPQTINPLIHSQSSKLFLKFLLSVWIFITAYIFLYFYEKAYIAMAAVIFGSLILSPINLLLEKKGFFAQSRLFFIISCDFYIYVTSLGFGHATKVEYYYIPSIIVALILFEITDLSKIVFSTLLPVVLLLITEIIGTSYIPDQYICRTEHIKIFTVVNFLGAYAITGIFLKIFVDTIREQRASLITAAKMSSLGEMAGGIAHEINNPLSIIVMKANQMRRRLESDPHLVAKGLDDLNKIEITANRIAKIIKGLRTFSRDSEKDPPQKNSLKEILDDTLELCYEKLKFKNIQLTSEIPADLLINCRPTQISQIFMNLVSNSMDAIEKLESPWIKITAQTENQNVKITIADSGPGIPRHIVTKMMQPFYTTKDIGKGTGLGLSISQSIAKDHGGQLYYDDGASNTTFILILPAII